MSEPDHPLDDATITHELIDDLMRKPPLELTEDDITRVVSRMRQARVQWDKIQSKPGKKSRQTGGTGKKPKKSAAEKGKAKLSDSEKENMDKLLGGLFDEI